MPITYSKIFLSEIGKINAMADACLEACEMVNTYGTAEMQATMRILLFQVGQELARATAKQTDRYDG